MTEVWKEFVEEIMEEVWQEKVGEIVREVRLLAHGHSHPWTLLSPAAPSPSLSTSAPADGRYGVLGSQAMAKGWRWRSERDCGAVRWPERPCVAVERHNAFSTLVICFD